VTRIFTAAPAQAVRRATASLAQPAVIQPVIQPAPRPLVQVEMPPLTAVRNVGAVRAQRLTERGLVSVDRLAAARVEDLADIVPLELATEIIADARRLRNLSMSLRKRRRD
jgi:hypothetical protein